jgi:chromosome segregation ATPase
MVEPNSGSQDQNVRQTEDQWQDRILADAIGYTRGLVAVLDSLTEGFRRRGQEVEEQKQRLTILQNERRAVLDQRAGLEAQLRSLTTERDALRADLEERNRDMERLRQELAEARAALEARTGQTQELRAALEASARRAEELQNEGRAALEARARLKADLQSLTTQRDSLQTTLENTERERERLRQEVAEGRTTLEARNREIERLQAAEAASTRQAEELREIVRGLERDRESRTRHITRLGEMERELLHVREAASRIQDEQAALRDSLTRTERLLDAARGDLASSRQLIERLKASLDEERIRTAALQEQLLSQREDLSRLDTAARAFSTALTEIAGIVGSPADVPEGAEADPEAAQLRGLVQAVRGQAETAAQTQQELAALRSLVESVREILGTTEALPDRLREVVAERALLTDRLQQIAAQWQQFRKEWVESIQRERELREENERLAQQVSALTTALEALRAPGEAPAEAAPEPPQGREAVATARPPHSQDRPSSLLVECLAKIPGQDDHLLLQARLLKANEVGMVVAFERRLTPGRALLVRFRRGQDEYSVPGSVVRVQPSAPARAGEPAFDHLIRFEHPGPDSPKRIRAFLS